jgi:hypothetical protein
LTKKGLAYDAQQMDGFCQEQGFVKWFETSARENTNILTAARFLITAVIPIFCLYFDLKFSFSSR